VIGVLISAWLDVRSKPLRTLAAIAGMVAAVAAVVLVDAAAVLSRSANGEYIARTYGRPATVGIVPESGTLSAEDAAATRLVTALRENGVSRVSVDVSVGVVLVRGDRSARVLSTWVSSSYDEIRVLDLVAGSFPEQTARAGALHAVVTLEAAQRLGFDGADAVGAAVWYAIAGGGGDPDLRTTPLRPLVIDAVARASGDAITDGVLLVSDLNQPDLVGPGGLSWLVHVHPADVPLVQQLMDGIGAVDRSGETVVSARRLDQGDQLAPVLGQQQVTARAVTWVALVVGGLGILGVGLASVRERGKDFGLRRALGASKTRVFAGVIVQTLLEVLLAAAIAIPLSAIVIEALARQLVLASLPLPSSTGLPLSSAARGLATALVVGLVAGLLPAFRAARASVVQALRG
jgi:putative ABC transport system permease protein